MVRALIKIDENTNKILNFVKTEHDLKNKGEVINFLVDKYIDAQNDPELKPEFMEELKKSMKEYKEKRIIRIKDFLKRYGLK